MTTRDHKSKGLFVNTRIVTWSGLLNGDDGLPVDFADHAERTVQTFGEFGVGGSQVWEGSLDGIHWAVLNDLQGNALSFTGPKIEGVGELVRFVRPRVPAGDATTNLTAMLLMKGK